MWMRWLPWRYIVSRMARSQGFLDPIALLSRLHRFAQPSEVTEPIELLRAGVVFHARGLINARAIQHNLDWVWPYWVERQFDPRSESFVPRAFSITHINLTHRNWTAVGVPDVDWLPIVDPCGLVTPMYDGWSIDAWLILDDGRRILPSRLGAPGVQQRLRLDAASGIAVQTDVEGRGGTIASTVDAIVEQGTPTCRTRYTARADAAGWFVLSVRPANPEGVSFVHDLEVDENGQCLVVNGEHAVQLDRKPRLVRMSEYRHGDVLLDVGSAKPQAAAMRCDVGMATAAAMYRVEAGESVQITTRVAMTKKDRSAKPGAATAWPDALAGHCEIRIPDPWMKFLYDAAIRSLVLHAPGDSGDVYPGPYTYKRFWFRDAAFILNGLLSVGLTERVRRCIDGFAARQTTAGYFLSQEGEWDSNGAAMWIMERYRKLSGGAIPPGWLDAVRSGARWIKDKRLSDDLDKPHAGLLPAGFSAEHLGPNDFYYWDDFWCAAGLRSAAEMLDSAGDPDAAGRARDVADQLLAAVERSLKSSRDHRVREGVPASPYRRMDAGAIGSITVGYPLQLWQADDPRLLATVEFILRNCMVRGGFFQDMIHSGVNAYLTLHLAQVLLRAGQTQRAFELVQAVADLASPTGQWPEAIHPQTLGGCMGDGQHLWAAADWVMMMRHLFVREEGDRLIIGQGLPAAWLNGQYRQDQPDPASRTGAGAGEGGTTMRLGPTPTPWGPITVEVTPGVEAVQVAWRAQWRGDAPVLDVRLVGCEAVQVAGDSVGPVRLARLATVHEAASGTAEVE